MEKIFKLEGDTLKITLPEGKTQEELILLCKEEIGKMIVEKLFAGRDIKIDGRVTTGMALCLGHLLSHACKSVGIYDPKEDKFVKAIWH